MPDVDTLIIHAREQPDSVEALLQLADAYLSDSTSADQRRMMRAAAANPAARQAYENLYFDGVGMEQPDSFIRRTLAALLLTNGFGSPDTARQVMSELRTFAAHHGVDFDMLYQQTLALPGARRSRSRRLRFLLTNLALIAVLVMGTLALQSASDGLRVVLQGVVLLVVVGGQILLLYWFFQSRH